MRIHPRTWALHVLHRAAGRLLDADDESGDEVLVLLAPGLNALDRVLDTPGLSPVPASLTATIRLGALH